MSELALEKWVGECLRKKRYSDLDTVERIKKKVWKERHVQLNHYECPHCYGYHVTKQRTHGHH